MRRVEGSRENCLGHVNALPSATGPHHRCQQANSVSSPNYSQPVGPPRRRVQAEMSHPRRSTSPGEAKSGRETRCGTYRLRWRPTACGADGPPLTLKCQSCGLWSARPELTTKPDHNGIRHESILADTPWPKAQVSDGIVVGS